ALAHATNMQNAITNVVEKLKSNSGYAADIYIFSENTVSVEIETEDKHTLTAHISPFSLAENLAKLRPTWAQRTLLNFMSYLNQTFGATFRLPLLLNFNPKFSGKAIDVTVRKLTYSLDFIEAYKEAIDTIIFITESLEKKTTQSHTERKAMQADLQTSITKLKGVIADYIYWKVPETYSPDTRIKEIKEGLPIYKYLFSAKNYSDVETIARSNILSNEAKLDLLYAQFKDTIGFENSKLYLDARNYVEKFFNSLSGQEKAQILSKRNARLLLKKLKLRVN
nr:hypothetical protein [Pseudomonadota bacterium]